MTADNVTPILDADYSAIWLGFWTVLVGIVCNVACAILGCYLVLRRMSMLGDAISHAVLPGLVAAFLLTGTLSGWGMALGAGVLGVLTAFLTQGIHRIVKVPEDASMGVVFTSLFAIGVIMINRVASNVDLDPGCVLYGLIEFAPLDTTTLMGLEVPRALQSLGLALLVTVGFVTLFWKELKIVSFDPALAAAMGIRVALVHYLLMGMVAGVTVAAFEAVGSILVVAMLIVPAAAAQMLTDRLSTMVIWSTAVAVLSAIFGYLGAVWLNTSVAGMMAVAAGGLFALAVLAAPNQGLVGRAIRRLRLALRIAREDVLASTYRSEEAPRELAPAVPTHPAWLRRLAILQLRRTGSVVPDGTSWRLTEAGRVQARELVRTHRLWETFMNKRLELPLDHVHDPADRMEHYTDPALSDQLAAELTNPERDPHGKPIPPPAVRRDSSGA